MRRAQGIVRIGKPVGKGLTDAAGRVACFSMGRRLEAAIFDVRLPPIATVARLRERAKREISDLMRVEGDYNKDGYATIRGLIPPEVASNLFKQLQMDLQAAGKSFETFAKLHDLSRHQTSDISGHFYRPLTTFLWGMTPIISELTGADVLPSYDYFRIYQKDDICRVHSDRPSCEHSVSLTIAYADDIPWPLEVGSVRVSGEDPCEEGWGDEASNEVEMQPGDAVLYRGIELRHGRTRPNPNRWSAHLFLFWVERGGKFEQNAFDAQRLRSELERVSGLKV